MKREHVPVIGLMLLVFAMVTALGARAAAPLRSPRAVGSVSVRQNEVVQLYPVQDAYVDHLSPKENYGASALLAVQYWNWLPTEEAAKRRSFVGFDLSAVPVEAVITQATFRAYMYGGSGRTSGAYLGLRRVTQSWDEDSVTWNTQPSSVYYAGQSVAAEEGWASWDVTGLVDSHWKGLSFEEGANYGLELRGPESGDRYRRWFRSSDYSGTDNDPRLEIEYFVPTPTPTATPIPWIFSGAVYDGETGNTTWPLAGVTVHLYEMGVPPNLLDTDVTGKDGVYSLEAFQWPTYDFHIVASDLPGYVSAGAIAGSEGAVVDDNTISYPFTIDRGTYGDNLFFDQQAATDTPTPTPSPTPTATPTSSPTPTPTPSACPVPLERVSISGPFTATVGSPITLTAEVSPSNATQPITYSWSLAPVVGQGTDQAQYLWEETGVITIHLEVENCGGADAAKHHVTVQPQPLPDLIITDVWEEGGQIWYQVRNTGDATAPAGHVTRLRVDGDVKTDDAHSIEVPLAPGERLRHVFELAWTCSSPQQNIEVCADETAVIDEKDEANNCREETWLCDTTPPRIISGPSASKQPEPTPEPIVPEPTPEPEEITWRTDEDSDSVVRYGKEAGAYDLEVRSADLVQDHMVTLDGLEFSTVYQYVVESSDSSGNSVVSKPHLFRTMGPPDEETPIVSEVTVHRMADFSDYYEITSSASDDTGVTSVAFYLDDQLIGMDYEPPYRAALHPALLGLKRDEFFQDHEIMAVATDVEGTQAPRVIEWAPEYTLTGLSAGFISPSDSPHEIAIGGSTVPPGTMVHVQVYVAEHYSADCTNTVWGCVPGATTTDGSDGPTTMMTDPCAASCEDMNVGVPTVLFYVDGLHKHTSHYAQGTPDVFHSYWWDVGDLGPGSYTITAWFVDGDGIVREIHGSRVVEIVRRAPSLRLEREVSRRGNAFNVALTVTNEGTNPAEVWYLEDNLLGFQVIEQTTSGDYRVYLDGDTDATRADVLISFLPSETLEPGGSVKVEYGAVPVLHPDYAPTDYLMGFENVSLSYSHAFGEQEKSVSVPCQVTSDGEGLAEAVLAAVRAADYLILTDDVSLYAYYHPVDVNGLLSTMAELARLESGVLGYTAGATGAGAEELIGQWGSQMMGSDGTPGRFASNGYLLIVGESDIVPSAAGTVDRWNGDSELVSLTDAFYADTHGAEINPELIAGRIIGNTPSLLRRPLETSIKVLSGAPGASFDGSHALLVAGWPRCRSGTCEGINFAHEVSVVAGHLEAQGVNVATVDNRDCADATVEENAFFAHAPDRDIIHLAGHGSATHIDGLSASDFDALSRHDPFGGAHPFVYASSCNTGRYLMTTSLAEAFLERGAGAYLGSTQVSYCCTNTAVASRFYHDWSAGESVGSVLRDVKRAIGGYYEDIWTAEYHLFGDPKYGLGEAWAGGTAAGTATEALVTPGSSIDVAIPTYEITRTETGEDRATIPGGFMVMEPGRPMVPFYSISLPYPQGTRVQDVSLSDRWGLSETTGISLTNFVPRVAGRREKRLTGVETYSDWWPEEAFAWSVHEDPDGSSELRIDIYPFLYNPLTTDVRFYQDYSFDVETITSTVELSYLVADRHSYPQGDEVHIEVGLRNDGEARDVIVEGVVRRALSDQVVDGLPLRSLDDFGGKASYAMVWDSEGFEPGRYAVDVRALDRDGNVLHTATEQFRLGIYAGEITSFEAAPEQFQAGDLVSTTLVFSNTGTVPLTGTAVIEVKSSDGEAVEIFQEDFENLGVGSTLGVDAGWDTSGVATDSYTVLGYVVYDAKATQPRAILVSNQFHVYLPVVLREY